MAGEFGPDGTQALPPLPVYPDALSGLVSQSFEDVPDTVVPPPAPLPEVNREWVRDAARRELARDRVRRAAPPVQPTPLPPAPGLQRSRTAPIIGAPAAGGLPPVPNAVQQTQRNYVANWIGCAVSLMVLFVVVVVIAIIEGPYR